MTENIPDWLKKTGVDFDVLVPRNQAGNDLSAIDWIEWEALGYDDLTNDELLKRLLDATRGI